MRPRFGHRYRPNGVLSAYTPFAIGVFFMPETFSPHPIQVETLSVAQLATLLGLSDKHVYRLAKSNRLPFPVKRIGGRILIPRRPAMAWLHADEKSTIRDDGWSGHPEGVEPIDGTRLADAVETWHDVVAGEVEARQLDAAVNDLDDA